MHTNLFNIVFLAFFLTLGSNTLHSQELVNKAITVPTDKQTITPKKTEEKIISLTDTIKKDSLNEKKHFNIFRVGTKIDSPENCDFC